MASRFVLDVFRPELLVYSVGPTERNLPFRRSAALWQLRRRFLSARNRGVLFCALFLLIGAGAQAANNFTAQERLGYTRGDQWEPATAADSFGHVYLLYPQYGIVPGCASCPSPTMVFQVSGDRGQNWS